MLNMLEMRKINIRKDNKITNNNNNWIIDITGILKTFKILIKQRCCQYTKCGKIDGYLKKGSDAALSLLL